MTGSIVDALNTYPEIAPILARLNGDLDAIYALIGDVRKFYFDQLGPPPPTTFTYPPEYIEDPELRASIYRRLADLKAERTALQARDARVNTYSLQHLKAPLHLFDKQIQALQAKIAYFNRFLKKPNETDTLDKDKANQILIHTILNIPDPQGRNFPCPFHTDKHPSARIYSDPQRFHCYSCNQHLDSIATYRLLHNTSFVGAVRALMAFSP